jgi:hypothetical protein
LRIGEIGEDLLRGLDDDVVTLRHSVPRVLPLARPVGSAGAQVFLRPMIRKSHGPDKR